MTEGTSCAASDVPHVRGDTVDVRYRFVTWGSLTMRAGRRLARASSLLEEQHTDIPAPLPSHVRDIRSSSGGAVLVGCLGGFSQLDDFGWLHPAGINKTKYP
jgi:hypothetical protein